MYMSWLCCLRDQSVEWLFVEDEEIWREGDFLEANLAGVGIQKALQVYGKVE